MNKAKILVVDDVPTNVVLMKSILSTGPYDVITSNTGLNITELISKEKPDLVILDIMMPGVDGYEALRCIRSNESMKELPVVMVSALGSADEISKAYELGANGFISKPIVVPQILQTVKDKLALKQ